MPDNQLKRYYIVNEHPLRIISKCKAHSKGTYVQYLVGFCALYAMINWIPEVLSLFLPATNLDLLAKFADSDPEMLSRLPSTPIVVFVYLMLFNGVFRLGECLYALTYIRNRQADFRAVGESMAYYLKTLGLYLFETLIISFWTMFLIIPGIITALNFSQAFYLLADDPDKKITQVLAESKIMMYGNKMNYFRLLVCYIPYVMIAYIPAFLLADLAQRVTLNSAGMMLLSFAADIPMFVVYGYISMGRTVFYELLINKGFAHFRYAGQQIFRELEQDRKQ